MSSLLARGRISLYHRSLLTAVCLGLLIALLLPASLYAQGGRRLLAPDFDGAVGPTLGADKPLKLKDLRGKIVVLEFWTLC